MHFRISDRRVKLSVGEFSEFRLGPMAAEFGYTGKWRTELGQTWHRELQNKVLTEEQEADVRFEVSVNALLVHESWTFDLQGRLDQLVIDLPNRKAEVREIKTVNHPLPCDPHDLLQRYPSYFTQLATYMALLGVLPEYEKYRIAGELIFIDIAEGVTQSIPSDPYCHGSMERQFHIFSGFLEDRWKARHRLNSLVVNPPFQNYRPGQKETYEGLEKLAHQSPIIAFEAPTGYGKTGTILEYAMNRLRDGYFERIIYLTGKSTGQLPVVDQIRKMQLGDETGVQFMQMRNRWEHAIESPLHTCDDQGGCRENLEENWKSSGLNPPSIFDQGTISLDTLKSLGRKTGVCPYAITKATLPYAEIWIGDYNYVFSPDNRGVFYNQPGFDPRTTLLIIDEAHNLPSRVAHVFSFSYSYNDAQTILTELQFNSFPPKLIQYVENLAHFLSLIKPCKCLTITEEYELESLITPIADFLMGHALEWWHLTSFSLNKLWQCCSLKAFFSYDQLETLIWVETRGEVKLTCLNAATVIEETIKRYAQVTLMSATLHPYEHFYTACGLSVNQVALLQGGADWRQTAYRVAIDSRVDTRLRSRKHHFGKTAETVSIYCRTSTEPVAVFFSSFKYAEEIITYLTTIDPFLRIAMQPRGVDLKTQQRFLNEALISSDAIFLVLGSSFSEGVDALGGRVSKAIIVGPALPEVNAIQDARMEALSHLPRSAAFQQVYQIPAMTKINQALGRLVRSPGQKADILLHCNRFQDETYQHLLHPDYQTDVVIKSDEDLEQWLTDIQDSSSL